MTEKKKKNPEEDKDQDLASETEGDRCKPSSDRMRPSKSSISESEKLRWKLKFQEKGSRALWLQNFEIKDVKPLRYSLEWKWQGAKRVL